MSCAGKNKYRPAPTPTVKTAGPGRGPSIPTSDRQKRIAEIVARHKRKTR